MARRLAAALAARDIDAVSLLADDIRMAMPRLPAIWQGRERAVEFLTEVAFRLVPEARFSRRVRTGNPRWPCMPVTGPAACGAGADCWSSPSAATRSPG
jgi:hypothetical protein